MIHKRTLSIVFLVLALTLAVSPLPAPAAQAQEAASSPAPGATDDWWAEALAHIEDDIRGLSTLPDWTVEGQAADDHFGYEVAGAGDVNGDGYADVVVGAYGYNAMQGKAYLFYGSAAGLETTWDWSATGEVVGDNFGSSVAGAGDVDGDGYADVVVGAPFYDNTVAPADNVGKAYLFYGGGAGLSTSPGWQGAGSAENGYYGSAVAGVGDNNGDGYADILVGAPGTGRVYLYRGGGAGLSANYTWWGVSEQPDNGYGTSVAGAGDVNGDGYADLIVGAPYHDNGGDVGAGKAYVYLGLLSGAGYSPAWNFVGETSTDWLGTSVAGAGDVDGDGYSDVIVGASGAGTLSNQGKAYLFLGGSGGLAASPAWDPSGESGSDLFGTAVAGAGDVNGDGYADVVVGASAYASSQGKVYAYYGGPSGLGSNWSWSYNDTYADAMGNSVAGAGDVNGDGYADLVVGAKSYSSYRGRAHVFHGAADPPAGTATWYETGESTWNSFGFSVAGAGDVNGDGYADVVVGARGFPNGDARGKAYAFYGDADGLSTFPNWTVTGEADGDNFGASVAGAGDVNGDGYADVIVGAYGAGRGKAYLYLGGASGLSLTANWSASGQTSGGSSFGQAVAGAGDVDGDGYADVIVGDPDYTATYASCGRAYLYLGSASGLSGTRAWRATGEAAFDFFGRAVAGAGDVNGDGFGDVIVGAYGYNDPSFNDVGRAYVYHGSAEGLHQAADWTAGGPIAASGNQFGWAVAAAGDVNNDGFGDVIVGAPGYNSARGAAYAYHGSSLGLGAGWAPNWALTGSGPGAVYGESVSGAGDLNGDGYADVVVGARGIGNGYAYASAGGPSGLATASLLWFAAGQGYADEFGHAVAGAGDVDGDGYADLIVGARSYGTNNEGRAYFYAGNDDGGREILSQQLRGDFSWRAVQPWGLSHSDSFALWIWAPVPMGRARVKAEVETCPPGVIFGSILCWTTESVEWLDTWWDASGNPRRLTVYIDNLEAGTLYRWRARLLYAPYTIDQTGITSPPNPAHGPWRRYLGQADEAGLRTMPNWQVYLPVVVRNHQQ